MPNVNDGLVFVSCEYFRATGSRPINGGRSHMYEQQIHQSGGGADHATVLPLACDSACFVALSYFIG